VEALSSLTYAEVSGLPLPKSDYHKVYFAWQTAQNRMRIQEPGMSGMLTSRWFPSLFSHRKQPQLLDAALTKARVLQLLQTGSYDEVRDVVEQEGTQLINHMDADGFTLVHRICALSHAVVDKFAPTPRFVRVSSAAQRLVKLSRGAHAANRANRGSGAAAVGAMSESRVDGYNSGSDRDGTLTPDSQDEDDQDASEQGWDGLSRASSTQVLSPFMVESSTLA
jgi:hypothetical protein